MPLFKSTPVEGTDKDTSLSLINPIKTVCTYTSVRENDHKISMQRVTARNTFDSGGPGAFAVSTIEL